MLNAYFYDVDTLEIAAILTCDNYKAIDDFYLKYYDVDYIGYQFSDSGLIYNDNIFNWTE